MLSPSSAGTLESLLADKAKLTSVLTYHVVAGKVMAADVVKLQSAKTVQGQTVAIEAVQGVRVYSANVIQTDIVTSNGVIHVIDAALMPSE
ncbi:MAG TPA: fasciclin domain-containing protein [Vicinamibacteria bacterium]